MSFFKNNWKWLILLTVVFIVGISITSLKKTNTQDRVTTTVTRGDVQQMVSISGFVEAKNTATLAFPVIGTVTDILIDEGSVVTKDDLLATLGSTKLVAQRSDAVAQLQKAQASLDQLIDGPTETARELTDTSIAAAQEALNNTIILEEEKIKSARSVLLSNDLQALSVDTNESATVPSISGSYICEKEGIYTLSVYASGGRFDYSYSLTGLEIDRDTVNTLQPAPLGSCGLMIQFTEGDIYANSQWTIEIPNKKSANYIVYKNAYELALKQQQQNIQAASDALRLAQKTGDVSNATPSNAELRQANAAVYSAQSRIAQIDAQIKDFSIVAPFDGMITSVDIRRGETATTQPVITLLAQDIFELKARVPEIDITKIETGQSAYVTFDAKTDTVIKGTVSFVSPLATEIDGVAYFEALITLDNVPQWMRSGLNADVDIVTNTINNTLRIPRRYLMQSQNEDYTVLTVNEKNEQKEVIVEVTVEGNDGYIGITGLNENDVIIAP